MKKEKKSESIAQELIFIRKSFDKISAGNLESNKELIEETNQKFENIFKFFNGIKKLVLLLLFSLLIFLTLLVISFFYVDKAQNITDEINSLKTDTIANLILDVERVMQPDSTYTTSYYYYRRGNKIITYKQLSKEVDSLENVISDKSNKIDSLENELNSNKGKIDLAKNYYGLSFWYSYKKENKKNVKYVNVESKKVDSALILLEAYRNKLHFNNETKKWEVK